MFISPCYAGIESYKYIPQNGVEIVLQIYLSHTDSRKLNVTRNLKLLPESYP